MRKNYIGKYHLLLFLCFGFTIACNSSTENSVPQAMNHEHVDSSILEINSDLISGIEVIQADSGNRIFTVSVQGNIGYDSRNTKTVSGKIGGRIEKLNVRYNYQEVRKGDLLLEIYSPDLVAAQRELLYVYKQGDENLISKAKQRLYLLGLSENLIIRILQTGEAVYRIPVYSPSNGYILENQAAISASPSRQTSPASGSEVNLMDNMNASAGKRYLELRSTPTLLREGQYITAGQSLFTIYQTGPLVAEFSLSPEISSRIKQGDPFLFSTEDKSGKMYNAKIDLILPAQQNGRPYTLTRTYLDKTTLRPGELVEAFFAINVIDGWWLPASAVYQSGSRSIVFRQYQGSFQPVQVRQGIALEGMVQILDNISTWKIAANAQFLIDSESFINPSVYE